MNSANKTTAQTSSLTQRLLNDENSNYSKQIKQFTTEYLKRFLVVEVGCEHLVNELEQIIFNYIQLFTECENTGISVGQIGNHIDRLKQMRDIFILTAKENNKDPFEHVLIEAKERY